MYYKFKSIFYTMFVFSVVLAVFVYQGVVVGSESLSKEQQYKQFARKWAVMEWSRQTSRESYQQFVKAPLDQLLKEIGIKNNQLRKKVITNFITSQSYADQLNTVLNGTSEQRNQLFNEQLGKVLISTYTSNKEAFKSGLSNHVSVEGVGTAVNVAGTVSSMIGALQNNDAKGALEYLANGINNAVVASKVTSAVVEYAINRTQLEVDMWKAEEMEKAFQAYKKGSDGQNGYDLDAGNFSQLTGQMKGVYQRYISDGIKEYAMKRGMSVSDVNRKPDLRNKVINDLEKSLKRQFDNRIKAENIINPKSEANENLVKELEKKELLNKYDSVVKSYFKDSDSLEFRLTRLFNIRDSIIAMIGTEKAEELNETEMAGLIKQWILSKRDRTDFESILKKRHLLADEIYKGDKAAWVLIDIIPENKAEQVKQKNTSYKGTYFWTLNVASNSVISTKKYTGPTKKTHSADMKNGESYTTTLSVSSLPSIIMPDDIVTVTMTAIISHNLSYYSADASALLQVYSIGKEGKKSGGTQNCYGKNNVLQVKAWGNRGDREDKLSDSLNVEVNMGKGSKNKRKIIQFATNGAFPATIKYLYEFKQPE